MRKNRIALASILFLIMIFAVTPFISSGDAYGTYIQVGAVVCILLIVSYVVYEEI